MITTTVGHVIAAHGVVQSLLGERSLQAPIRVRRYLGVTVVQALNSVLKTFSETRDELIRSYDQKTPEGQYSVPKEQEASFYGEVNKMLTEPVDLLLNQINIDDLETFTLSAAELAVLDFLISADK